MNLDHPHLAPQAAALLNMTDDLRIRATRTERWIGFSRAKFALERLQFLCDHPPSTRPPGLAICAHSGMGKTMLVEKFRRTNPPTVDTIAGAETVPVLSISLSSKPSERRIYAQLLSSSGASLRHAMTLVEMEVRALSILKHLKVRVIVIDEVHNLLAGSPREQRVILFRPLSNELKASLVFLGIADASGGDSRRYATFETARSNGVAGVEGRRLVSESCGRDPSKPAAATFCAHGSALANACTGDGRHNRKSLQHVQRARRGSGSIQKGANHRRGCGETEIDIARQERPR